MAGQRHWQQRSRAAAAAAPWRSAARPATAARPSRYVRAGLLYASLDARAVAAHVECVEVRCRAARDAQLLLHRMLGAT